MTPNAKLSTVRFLDLIKPFTPLLPEVASPETKVPFNQKLMWTGVRLFLASAWILGTALKSDIRCAVDFVDLLGDEPDASVRYRVF